MSPFDYVQGRPICMINVADDNKVYYYHFDGLGSVIALSDSAGNTVQTYEYTVWGEVAAEDVNHPNPIMFTGRWFDRETGLYYYRARYYNPYIGRFLQTDPVGYGYSYCGNNPLGLTDPSGALWIGVGLIQIPSATILLPGVESPWSPYYMLDHLKPPSSNIINTFIDSFAWYLWGGGAAAEMGPLYFEMFKRGTSYRRMIGEIESIGRTWGSHKVDAGFGCQGQFLTWDFYWESVGTVYWTWYLPYNIWYNFYTGTVHEVWAYVEYALMDANTVRYGATFELKDVYQFGGGTLNNWLLRRFGLHLVGTPYPISGSFWVSGTISLKKEEKIE
jgi:RHS repeat-associated protein